MKSFYSYNTPIGKLGLSEEDGYITNLYLSEKNFPKDVNVNETEILKTAGNQLDKYFRGELREFDLPLNFKGTDFQKKVWNALCQIPYGKTATYKDIATMVGNPKASRAVGLANNKNPIAIFVPCHRIIGANGSLVGYAGGLDMKRKLLELEQK